MMGSGMGQRLKPVENGCGAHRYAGNRQEAHMIQSEWDWFVVDRLLDIVLLGSGYTDIAERGDGVFEVVSSYFESLGVVMIFSQLQF